jgi:phosphatidylserine/phosphatidylglycerophosphate/cardiolipin synthase-like enzyme
MPETDPDRLDLGAIHASEGFFLLRSVEQRPFDGAAANGARTWRFCSTFRASPRSLREAVLELIRSARRKVFVTSFVLGDDEVADALVATANRLPGGVYVISELAEHRLRDGLARLPVGGSADLSQRVAEQRRRLAFLVGRGVPVRGHEHCHAGFVVVDDDTALLGTANLDTDAFTRLGEVGVVTSDAAEVGRLARLFARMWLSGCTQRLPEAADTAVPHDGVPVDFPVPVATVDTRPAVLWTDAEQRGVLDSVHDVVRRAERHLLLASARLGGMLGRPDLLVNPLAEAIARGVRVEMLVRAGNDGERHRRDAGLLRELGVHLVADDLNHANAAIADDRHGVLFSAPFDADRGLDAGGGIEVAARLDGTDALPGLAGYLRHALDTATREYVHRPTARRLNEELGASWQHRWPLPGEITVRADPRVWHRLVDESRPEPVLWTRPPGRPVELCLGRTRIALRQQRNTEYHVVELDRAGGTPGEELDRWWRTPDADGERGYCPAVLRRAS